MLSTLAEWFDGVAVSNASVEGATIRYRRYPNPGRQVLLLVHGGGANAAWWLGLLPTLASRFDVLVTDLSGHGLSDHRQTYGPRLWAKELAAILDAENVHEAAVVGHSMGGFVTVSLCAYHPERVARGVLIDSGLRSPGVDGASPRGRERRRSTRIYDTFEEALARFRLVPEQPVVRPELVEAVAHASLKRVDDGWTWRFDPQIFQRFTDAELDASLRASQRPLALIYGALSPGCGPDTVAYIQTASQAPLPAVCIPNAYHHVPLDQPELTSHALTRLLAPAEP